MRRGSVADAARPGWQSERLSDEPSVESGVADVALTVWTAANDDSDQLRFPDGPDAVALARAA
jgi:hypothetical protein